MSRVLRPRTVELGDNAGDVHLAEQHRRVIPHSVLTSGAREMDPDVRVLAMLGARSGVPWQQRGNAENEISRDQVVSAG